MDTPPKNRLVPWAILGYALIMLNNAWHIGEVYRLMSGYPKTILYQLYSALCIVVAELLVLLFSFSRGRLKWVSWPMVAIILLGNLSQYQLQSAPVANSQALSYAFSAMFSVFLPFLGHIIAQAYTQKYQEAKRKWRSQMLAQRNTAWKERDTVKEQLKTVEQQRDAVRQQLETVKEQREAAYQQLEETEQQLTVALPHLHKHTCPDCGTVLDSCHQMNKHVCNPEQKAAYQALMQGGVNGASVEI